MAGWSLLSSLNSNVISERISLSSISKSELPCASTFHHSRELTECISFCSYLSYLYTQDFVVVVVHSFLCLLSVSSHQRGERYASGELVCLGHHYITRSCQNAWNIADTYYYFPSGWAKKMVSYFSSWSYTSTLFRRTNFTHVRILSEVPLKYSLPNSFQICPQTYWGHPGIRYLADTVILTGDIHAMKLVLFSFYKDGNWWFQRGLEDCTELLTREGTVEIWTQVDWSDFSSHIIFSKYFIFSYATGKEK